MNVQTKSGVANISGLTDCCPYCFKSITPNIIYGYHKVSRKLDVFLSCPDSDCLNSFVGEYESSSSSTYYFTNKLTKGNIKSEQFNHIISDVSANFVTIYNQAYYAEQTELLEICGVGYRKALEFLIKEYCVLKNPEKKEGIEKSMLAKCIADYIDDSRIKKVAKRATWLGNDETHYIRKWEGKNLTDLKTLIKLTIHWIEMEKLTDDFESEMPD
ncbi:MULTISPECIES: hypothetical protein [unclassified Flavobacterium]|jgi:hypothetical protein|uniref:hypothetical protein n=1 Tax=unclassified Flavobacterium TaxID=196869 RepID=UPI0025BEE7D4|nr:MULTISPECIES: hypothetical protein [unclassified Flavobacterium]